MNLSQAMDLLSQELPIDRGIQLDGFCASRNEFGCLVAKQIHELFQLLVPALTLALFRLSRGSGRCGACCS